MEVDPNVCCLIYFSLYTPILSEPNLYLRIMLLVKANFSLFSYSVFCLGNKTLKLKQFVWNYFDLHMKVFLDRKSNLQDTSSLFKMMGKHSSPGSWRIETVGKRNSHGRRYVGIARLEVQIPGHEDETIGLYIDSLGWQ